MTQTETNEYWQDILEKFFKHKGAIASFCREHDVNIHIKIIFYNKER